MFTPSKFISSTGPPAGTTAADAAGVSAALVSSSANREEVVVVNEGAGANADVLAAAARTTIAMLGRQVSLSA